MEKQIIHVKITEIQTGLGMNAETMAKLMNVSANTFNKKRSEKELRHWFSEQNLIDLKNNLKIIINKLAR